MKSHLLRGIKLTDLLTILCLIGFFIFKYLNHVNLQIFDVEEFYKTRFLFKDKDFFYFFPGNHADKDFYGHPGLNNFLYYLFSIVFGNSLESVRLFSLTLSVGLVASIYIYVSEISSRTIAFFTSLTFLLIPMFQVQSIMFFNEIPSLFFMFLSLYFFNKEKRVLFSLCGVFSVLCLESSIAIYIALGALKLFQLRKGAKVEKYVELVTIALPIFVLFLFFVFEKIGTGRFSNHVTSESVASRLSNVKGTLLDGVVWSSLWRTLHINFSEIVLTVFPVSIMLYLLVCRRRLSFSSPVAVMLLAASFYLIYFGYLSEYSGGRDYYFILFLYLFLLYKSLSALPRVSIFASAAVFISASYFSYNKVTDLGGHTRYQSSHFEYEGQKEFESAAMYLSRLSEKIRCHKAAFGTLFCHEGFGLKSQNVNLVDDFREPTYVIEEENSIEPFISNHDGRIKELERVQLPAIRGMKLYALKVVSTKNSE